MCVLRFSWPLGPGLQKGGGYRRENRQAQQGEPLLPLHEPRPHIFELPEKGKVQCATCRKPHHHSLCDEGSNPTYPADPSSITAVGKLDPRTPAFTYLQTAQVWITGPTGLSRLTRCVLDSESQSSFITDTLIEDPKLRTIEHRELNVSTFESQFALSNQCRLVRFNITGA